MRTTLEIPDDLYQQAKVQAAHENRKIKDLVSEGLRLVLAKAISAEAEPEDSRRKVLAAMDEIRCRPSKPDETGALIVAANIQRTELTQLEIVQWMRERPVYPPGGADKVIHELTRMRKEGRSRGTR